MCGIYGRISFTSKIESLENTDLEMETNTTLAPSSSQNENLLQNEIFQLFFFSFYPGGGCFSIRMYALGNVISGRLPPFKYVASVSCLARLTEITIGLYARQLLHDIAHPFETRNELTSVLDRKVESRCWEKITYGCFCILISNKLCVHNDSHRSEMTSLVAESRPVFNYITSIGPIFVKNSIASTPSRA